MIIAQLAPLRQGRYTYFLLSLEQLGLQSWIYAAVVYKFIATSVSMFEGQRLSYIVPGYTGHISKKVYDEAQPIQKAEPVSKIPGYAGYVPAIKPENIYGNTFGKTTLDVGTGNFIKGQDFQAKDKYVTSHTFNHLPPSERLQRTAANIVGVPDTKIVVKEPVIESSGKEVDQFTTIKTDSFKKTAEIKDTKWADNTVVEKNGKDYVQLGNPLPGYTGFGKRVLANNIFGKTYAECRKDAKKDDHQLHHDRNKHFQTQLQSDIPFKF